ncbi:MAG TPA: dihydrofolate reductase [Caldimonas sp.]|jgi:dihydrofolate reductase|nr:dihydrofolate reductase [Caldimonas sp.]HEX4232865.1 dihydrofolate reductase [Caldimonas sp.]
MSRPAISLVAIVARDGGIGHRGGLLVHLPEDLRRFKQLTLGTPIVMGRKTWQAVGRALPGRRNIVVTRDRQARLDGAEIAASFDDAIALAGDVPVVRVIGGAEIYALALPRADELQLTEIDAEFPADTFFPAWDRARFALTARELHETAAGLRYAFATYKKRSEGE